MQNAITKDGLECLRVLNEIIYDFDKVICRLRWLLQFLCQQYYLVTYYTISYFCYSN